eukprot:TRINITY_DN1599_c0_g1_i1.p1 TRINITY_DN1599_c0_g1~~TRINITY_DN1599_c0_g1_i1.p1  ORF type:complete len:380 (-),score=147.52 TRINITY_DN1599_c0_g1_i1:207-1346(-)
MHAARRAAPRFSGNVRRLFSSAAEAGQSQRSRFAAGFAAGTATAVAVYAVNQSRSAVSADGKDFYIEKRLGDLEVAHASQTSGAFVFIKPHAVTDEVKKLVKETLGAQGIEILSEGSIAAEVIDKNFLIDKHYGAIAAKAVKLKPDELTVQPKAKDAFKAKFGLAWDDALKQGKVFNAMDGAKKLGISTDELGDRFGKGEKLKFGGGFYCGQVGDIFVINGFYMAMRGKFTAPGTEIYYFETQWPTSKLAWGDFRGKVLGGTDPKKADPESLRHVVYKKWQSLGLKAEPNTGDNGVHASASPFEALAERNNWLGVPLEADFFGRAMLAAGVPYGMMEAWTDDPPVKFEGKAQSLFDLLEDLDGRDCLKKSADIAAANSK